MGPPEAAASLLPYRKKNHAFRHSWGHGGLFLSFFAFNFAPLRSDTERSALARAAYEKRAICAFMGGGGRYLRDFLHVFRTIFLITRKYNFQQKRRKCAFMGGSGVFLRIFFMPKTTFFAFMGKYRGKLMFFAFFNILAIFISANNILLIQNQQMGPHPPPRGLRAKRLRADPLPFAIGLVFTLFSLFCLYFTMILVI